MSISFLKMHGLGNDFVILDLRRGGDILTPERVRQIADRQRGVGCDQLIHLLPPKSAGANVFLDMYNADGSSLGACGNASRCVADLVMRESGARDCILETVAGLLYCTRAKEGQITVDMGVPRLEWSEIPILNQCDTLHLPLDGDPVGVSMGNPHCVFFCEDPEVISVDKLGPKIEHNPLFPERTNVEYVGILGPDHLRMRVWERGAGITQACGTGACASAVAAIRRGLAGRSVRVTLDGGDLLIEWRESDGHVLMTGPVAYVFEGTILG
ncbi:MAG: diaminopimelate epimerase [Micavibrio aeruginosavorus]|uniref:Diaminopimelate epimerase n=1 Tax=Micavibrio aeruginosavorus TaxID=349221 RepID=A0A2W5N4K7_9BACT|nr:MAG: diaminopimelate epimerase [Micavibrio aeruginosavorus]